MAHLSLKINGKSHRVDVGNPKIAPSGAGEPPPRPTAAAINNTIFDATGVRLRRAPLSVSVAANC
jgi:CO/xanthine dehydrogenase Mo-binding subunit